MDEVRVPREPTEAMLQAACDAGIFLNMTPAGWARAYRTMIAAAPQPAVQPEPAVALLWQVRRALALACAICDAVPNRDPGYLGKLVNAQPDGTHGYREIHDAEAALVSYLTTPTQRPEQQPAAQPEPAPPPMNWTDGEPPHPWRTEWFIAETIHGDRVVLRALPKQHTYDYKTADETYLMSRNIKRWMQFPDSEFVSPQQPEPASAEPVAHDMPIRSAHLLDVGFHYKNGVHTPTVLIGFAAGDWDSRDKFVEQFKATHPIDAAEVLRLADKMVRAACDGYSMEGTRAAMSARAALCRALGVPS